MTRSANSDRVKIVGAVLLLFGAFVLIFALSRSNDDDLESAADEQTSEPTNSTEDDTDSTSSDDSDSTTEDDADLSSDSSSDSTASTGTTAPPSTSDEADETADSTTTSQEETAPTTVRETATAEQIAAAQPGVIIEMQPEEIRLVGGVSSDAIANESLRVAQTLFPASEIVDEQVVDPSFPLPEELVFRLSAADLFGYNSDDINTTYVPLIDQLAEHVVDTESWSVVVTGHTDDVGPASGNQRLSERRANAGAARLIEQGVESDRVTVIGAGENEPIASNETDAGRLANRRIEFVITEQ